MTETPESGAEPRAGETSHPSASSVHGAPGSGFHWGYAAIAFGSVLLLGIGILIGIALSCMNNQHEDRGEFRRGDRPHPMMMGEPSDRPEGRPAFGMDRYGAGGESQKSPDSSQDNEKSR